MLILARRVGEEIVIGDEIHVVVMAIEGGHTVKIGVQAPKDISVHRREVQDRIDKERG